MRTIAIFSGGLDSTVLLYHLLAAGDDVLGMSVDYGQRHRVELDYARRAVARLGIPWQLADLSPIAHLLAGSSQTSENLAVPHGHYEEDSMKQTVVPNRNMIMLAVAGGWAIGQKADRLAYGAHTGDHTIYPDCRPEFVDAMRDALSLADWHRVELVSPFLTFTKAEIVARGAELGVDFTQTWSCYEGGEVHCGACGTCYERREAFEIAGVPDPTEYLQTPAYRKP